MNASSQALYGLRTSAYGHDVTAFSGIHRPSRDDETRAYVSANKHVECADCHGVHAATTTRHTTSLVNGNLVSGALAGVPGADPTFSGAHAVFEHPDPAMSPEVRERAFYRTSLELLTLPRIMGHAARIPVAGFPETHVLSVMKALPLRRALRRAYREWEEDRQTCD